MPLTVPNKKPLALLCSLLLCLFYWIYLFFNTRMEIIHDASVFDRLGRDLYEHGWVNYMVHYGTSREPFYPALIAFACKIAHFSSINYLDIQKIIQILYMLLTQGLMIILMRGIKIHDYIIAGVILYFGISPAMINAVFSLYYEIATYPFVLGIILLSVHIQQNFEKISPTTLILNTLMLAFFSIVLIFTKFPFYYILMIFYLPFYWTAVTALIKKNRPLLLKSGFVMLTLLVSINLSIFAYKKINQTYNGHFEFTDRGFWMVYASTYKRAECNSLRSFLVFLSTIPGDGICRSAFTPSECEYWSHIADSGIGSKKSEDYSKKGLTAEQIEPAYLQDAVHNVVKSPLARKCFSGNRLISVP